MKAKYSFLYKLIIVSLILTIVAIIFTYPLIVRMNNAVPGYSQTSEPLNILWYFWWLKYAMVNHLNPDFCNISAYPFGIDLGKLPNYPVFSWLSGLLAFTTNEVFTYNFWILASFLLSGLGMYCLVAGLSGSFFAGLISAIIFAFCPYHFAHAWQHLSLANIQWLPFFVYALLKLDLERKYKYAFFAAFSLALIFAFDYYYAFFSTVIIAGFVFFKIFFRWKVKLGSVFKCNLDILKSHTKTLTKQSGPYLLTVFIALALCVPLIFPNWKTTHQILEGESMSVEYKERFFSHSFEDLFNQSARPLSYLLPSSQHPILGKITNIFIDSPFYGKSLTEHSLYLGYLPMFLAAYALAVWKKRRRGQNLTLQEKKEDYVFSFTLFSIIVAWLFSQPPWWRIAFIKINMPSFYMFKILPMFRAYSRFGIIVMLFLSILAGFGAKFFLERFRSSFKRSLVAVLICSIVLFEFLNFPPAKIVDLSKVPAAYIWLEEQPSSLVMAEYPLDYNGASSTYRFFQTRHHKKTINGSLGGTVANNLAQEINELSKEQVPSFLAWMKVKYVLVHPDVYKESGLSDVVAELQQIKNNKGLKFIQELSGIQIYEVVANPVKPNIKK